MKYLKNVDWWSLLKEIILPHVGTLILYLILFFVVGIVCGIIYNVVLWKKQFYKREPKYYNWGAKLYIVASMGVFIYFSLHLTFIFAAKSIIKKEENRIVSQIYEQAAVMAFETPELRNNFIRKIQEGTIEIQAGTKNTAVALGKYVASKNVGIGFVDKGKNKLAVFIFDKYKDDIYSASLYGMLLAAGRGHVKIEDLSYDDLKALVATLNTLEPKKIEESIKIKLTEKVDELVSAKISALIKSTFILFILILLIPIVEFYIYTWWWKQKVEQAVTTDEASASPINGGDNLL
ncbi:MAG: hypothetical protein EOO96_10620 [Pedobacter sp.]|nr:MAG: hypothetical protein EOO96_10620 [Pedobacter sp.]